MARLLILGNGIAAVSAAEAFRQHDSSTPITIVSEEPHYAYYRLRLSKYLGENPSEEDMLIHQPGWYAENGIEVLLDRKAVSIDTVRCKVTLDDGSDIGYSSLLIATGSSPFKPPVPGCELKGVFSIRTLDDVKNLYKYSKERNTGVVIGGGVLGLEAAWSLAKKGKKIYVVEGNPYILSKQLDEQASEILKSLGEKAGIEFLLSNRLERVLGDTEARGIVLRDGRELKVDFVILSTGVKPNTGLLEGSGIAVARGIIVDEFMRTNLEGVYAAGDVAEYRGQVHGIWPMAREQGKTAGLNLAGIKTQYNEVVPSNYIKVFETEIFSAGDLCKAGDAEAEILDFSPEENIYRKIFFKGNRAVGVILLGDVKAGTRMARGIKSGRHLPDSLLKNTTFDEIIEKMEE
ncbi:NAD(P)/FAD-dependent oxidoreductase [Thermosediminibacter oceani]|nr:FAD-dependent oxidoreductase [Thermosediminibacter oceani]